MAGSTLPQCSRMQYETVSVTYKDGISTKLSLRNPETWWPIEQDYLLDDHLFVNNVHSPRALTCNWRDTRSGCGRFPWKGAQDSRRGGDDS